MTKYVGASAGIHLAVLVLAFAFGFRPETPLAVSDVVSVRIRRRGGAAVTGAAAAAPEDVRRSQRRQTDQPVLPTAFDPPAASPPSTVPDPVPAVLETPGEPAPADSEAVAATASPGALDPLAGMDAYLTATAAVPAARDPWSLTWESGRERGILSFPEVDPAHLPASEERLLDVVMTISVSPQGDVLSADIAPPGSGDIRIDRYLHSLALQLVLGPGLDDGGPDVATLRFLFRDGEGR